MSTIWSHLPHEAAVDSIVGTYEEDPNDIMAATSVTQQQTSTNLANKKRDAQCR
jgi:hypothetical protein